MTVSKSDDEILDQLLGVKPAAPREAVAGNRLARIDPEKYRKPARLTELQPRHLAMAQYMVFGLDDARQAALLGVEVHTPLNYYTAGDAARVRRKEVRTLINDPLFRGHLAKELKAFREAHHPEAITTMIEVMRDPGDNKAADRTVRLKAARALIGEENKNGVTVNVANNLGAPLVAGIVIRLPASTPPPPLELEASGGEPSGSTLRTDPQTMQQRLLEPEEDE